jgi:hypothetical protein
MAMKRQNDAIAAQEAYRARRKVSAAVEARIASHGADDLPGWLVSQGYQTGDMTLNVTILMMVNRLLGRAARDACAEVLP